MIDPRILAFFQNEGITLGYYSPGGVPTLSYWKQGAKLEPHTESSTYIHEATHEDLTVTSPYGVFSIAIGRLKAGWAHLNL